MALNKECSDFSNMRIHSIDTLDEAQKLYVNKGLSKNGKALNLSSNLIKSLDGIQNLIGLNIDYLNLSYNRLADIPDVSNLRKLDIKALSLEGNPFLGSITNINDFFAYNLPHIKIIWNKS